MYAHMQPQPACVRAVNSVSRPVVENLAGTDKDYRQKVRSLSYNLSDASNPELRARVLQGEVTPDRLVQMTPAEMASKVSHCHHYTAGMHEPIIC